MEDIKKSLGISNFGPWYIEMLPEQDLLEELTNMDNFIKSIIYNKSIDIFNSDNIDIQFINYGKTQLVYVVTVDNSMQYTLLVSQPATKQGTGKNEFDNLNRLNQLDSKIVIKPIQYFEKDNEELYITQYYHQARCIGVNTVEWGVWVPEPLYHFDSFNDNNRAIINSTMIAMLIKLYDEENNKGISKCRLDGGDFMLLKGYENEELTFDNITDHLKLIAARELTSISLDEYIDRIRKELSNKEEKEQIIVGKKLRKSFTDEEIEIGIKKGLSLRNNIKKRGL